MHPTLAKGPSETYCFLLFFYFSIATHPNLGWVPLRRPIQFTLRLLRDVTMLYNAQNHWISALCPSSGILVFSSYLEFQTIDEVQKPIDSEGQFTLFPLIFLVFSRLSYGFTSFIKPCHSTPPFTLTHAHTLGTLFYLGDGGSGFFQDVGNATFHKSVLSYLRSREPGISHTTWQIFSVPCFMSWAQTSLACVSCCTIGCHFLSTVAVKNTV